MDSTAKLPPGMIARTWKTKSGKICRAYYYQLPREKSGKRPLISLGTDLDAAIRRLQVKPMHAVASDEFREALFARTKKNAKSRGIPFMLTPEHISALYFRAGGRCEVSGVEFDERMTGKYRARPWIPSIDRIDPKGPYSFENCQLVCAYINMALNEFGLEMLLFMSKSVVYHATKNALQVDALISSRTPFVESNSNYGESDFL